MMKFLNIIAFGLLLSFSGCKRLVEVPAPVTTTNSENVYLNDATAAAVLTGMYTTISNDGVSSGPSATSLYLRLSAGELGFY